jgi:hypothetical protein
MKLTVLTLAAIGAIVAVVWYFFLGGKGKAAAPATPDGQMCMGMDANGKNWCEGSNPPDQLGSDVHFITGTEIGPITTHYMGETVAPATAPMYVTNPVMVTPVSVIAGAPVSPITPVLPKTLPVLNPTVEAAIQGTVAALPGTATTGQGGLSAAQTILGMNMKGVNPDGTCRQSTTDPMDWYDKNPFGICQYHYNWPYCMDYNTMKPVPRENYEKSSWYLWSHEPCSG